MKKLIIFSAFLLLCAGNLLGGDQVEVSVDTSVGYSVLSSDDNSFYRNHADLSEGFLLENLRLTALSQEKWFDRMELTARTGDRDGAGRKIRFDIRKTGRYSFTLQQSLNFDYFSDDTYNFGANARNAVREALNAEFRWMGFQHVSLVAGYGLNETNGFFSQPYSGWLDVYPIRLNRDTSRESFHIGADIRKGSFRISLRQAWVTMEEASVPIGSVSNAAGETFPSTLTTTRSGITEWDIPTTKLSASYSGNIWWINASWSKQDASLDLDTTDLKSYLFTDYGQRTDFLSTWFGTGDAPTTRASAQLSVMPLNNLTISYNLDMVDTETESSLATSRSMMLYGTGDTPLVTLDEAFNDSYHYDNSRTDHGLTVSYKPHSNWTIDLRFSQMDGDIIQEQWEDGSMITAIEDTYETNHTELGIKYRHDRGTLAIRAFDESIEDLTFRTAGDKKTGLSLTGDMELTDRLSATLFIQQAKLENKDPLVQLSDDTSVIDLGIHFRPVKNASLGIGVTRMELDYAALLFFTEDRESAAALMGTDAEQMGYYLTGNWQKDRLSASASLFYLDDSGTSLPLSTWNARLSASWRLTDSLSALLSLRYLDYAEDAQPLHDYNLNQVVFGLRWIYQ